MTKYTDEQINEAIQKAAEKNTAPPVYAWEFNMYKKVIDHLPYPQDDWIECTFEDIQKGDTIKYETPDTLIEPKHLVFRKFGDELVFVGGMKVWNHPDAKWYRIPAPVQHPDPKEHPVILVEVADGGPDAFVWDGISRYVPVITGMPFGSMKPEDVADFTPAKVVADNDR